MPNDLATRADVDSALSVILANLWFAVWLAHPSGIVLVVFAVSGVAALASLYRRCC